MTGVPVLEGDGSSEADVGGDEIRVSEVLPFRSVLQ